MIFDSFLSRSELRKSALAEGGDGLAQALERNLYGGANPDRKSVV